MACDLWHELEEAVLALECRPRPESPIWVMCAECGKNIKQIEAQFCPVKDGFDQRAKDYYLCEKCVSQ